MKTIKEIQEEIQVLQKQIEDIQKSCDHPNYEVVMYFWRPGAFLPSRICKNCLVPLQGITDDEDSSCRKEWNKNFPQVGVSYESKD